MASPFTGLPAGGFRVDSRERIRRLLHTADPQLSVIPLVEETVRGAHESVDNPQDVYVDERGLRVEGLKAFSDDYDIGYDLLSDEGSAVIREFGILNTIIDPNDPRAERFNGLPFPGTYVVDGEGVVTEKFFNRHYGTRTSAGTILDSALGRVLRHEEAPEAAYSDERAVVTAFMSGPTLTLEVTNTLYVRIEMAEGLHIYGEPLPESYYATLVSVEPTPGIAIGEPAYPPTSPMRFEALDVTLNVYEGVVDVAVPITARAELFNPDYTPTTESVELNVVVEYQVCSDTVCYLPEKARLSLSVPTSALATPGQ